MGILSKCRTKTKKKKYLKIYKIKDNSQRQNKVIWCLLLCTALTCKKILAANCLSLLLPVRLHECHDNRRTT